MPTIAVKPIAKILVANRGEIALRVMRTAREMGIATVAVFSDADRNALHVQFADEAVHIGPPASSESYLVIDKIVAACRLTNADAVHPGYGFLSENPLFAERLEAEGITLIGPSALSMRVMGNKLAAKAAVLTYGIPMVPGTETAISDVEAATARAVEVGFPVLIKAAAGGGGKGMRVVERAEDFASQMQLAASEALASFGDGAVFIEKYIGAPKHIEVQVMGDTHGNIVHLFERECSIQRRHQKVVEEAPSMVLSPELRERMGQSAVQVAKACNYVGAGTVEFLLDENHNFYFLEMNTRLQVEHPVTEMITGVDLVREQIRVAEGHPLSFAQGDLHINGHALELRVYAEDPENNFLPDIGTLKGYRLPTGPGVRVDGGFEEGMGIPIYYDPMIAKLVVHAPDRPAAIAKMLRAIAEYRVTGVATTLPFGTFIIGHPLFASGDFDTNFIAKHYNGKLSQELTEEEQKAAAIIASRLIKNSRKQQAGISTTAETQSAWRTNRLR